MQTLLVLSFNLIWSFIFANMSRINDIRDDPIKIGVDKLLLLKAILRGKTASEVKESLRQWRSYYGKNKTELANGQMQLRIQEFDLCDRTVKTMQDLEKAVCEPSKLSFSLSSDMIEFMKGEALHKKRLHTWADFFLLVNNRITGSDLVAFLKEALPILNERLINTTSALLAINKFGEANEFSRVNYDLDALIDARDVYGIKSLGDIKFLYFDENMGKRMVLYLPSFE